MSRKSNRRAKQHAVENQHAVIPTSAPPQSFSFGDPIPVLDGHDVLEHIECWSNGRYYEPPVSVAGLAKTFRASVHHASAIYVKRNILASTFRPHRLLSRADFSQWALDYLIFGNGYLEERRSRLHSTMKLQPALAKYTRRGVDPDAFFFVRGWQQEHEFEKGSVFHLREPDINQEIYGLPEYLSAMQSAWLNESATLFRRKYYTNGSHAGFILYMTDAAHSQTDIDKLREAMRNSKGPGNFRNLFMYAPGGKKDGIQLLPVSEVTAKDEFFNIKSVTREDVLAAHRVPPQLMSIMPTNTSGFGPVLPAAQVFAENELVPLQERFKEVNEWLGEDVVQFDEYALAKGQDGAA